MDKIRTLSSGEWESVRERLLDAYELMAPADYPSLMRWATGRLAKSAAVLALEASLTELRGRRK